MRIAGPAVDRIGSTIVAAAGVLLFIPTVWLGFGHFWSVLPIPLIFCSFWFAMAVRNVSFSTLASRVPRPQERARFMSITSACQHMAGAIAAFLSSLLLSEGPGGVLIGMEHVAMVSIGLALTVLPLMFLVEHKVKSRDVAIAHGTVASSQTVWVEG